MRLWNEYEGTTIAGIFPIEKLIRPEGRSAFFSTTNGTGTPAVLRLIEAINDEAEILTRWKAISNIEEVHLIKLKKFGQTVYMDTPLIYVLMEASEADLAGILQERPLTADETRQIANSLVDALKALHASGFVHEHIEPSNVMATAGDVVKLRSDCVRETPEGDEGIALQKQDIQDFATLLLQSLTQHKTLAALGASRLPVPFDQIVRNALNGTWGLAQIDTALNPPAPVPLVRPDTRPEARPTAAASAPSQPQQIPFAMPQPATTPAAAKPVAPFPKPPIVMPQAAAPHQDRITVPVAESNDLTRRRMWMAIAPAVIVVAGALGWHALHRSTPANEAVTTLADTATPAANTPIVQPVAPPTTTPAPVVAAAPPLAAPDTLHPWRVVAYTYNRRDQAQHKVETLAQQDASLRPEVFSPSSSGSFLVTLGGAMTRDEAVAFRQKAQGEGLPRDIYIQNYESHEQRQARRHR
jgi:hypothetical protein